VLCQMSTSDSDRTELEGRLAQLTTELSTVKNHYDNLISHTRDLIKEKSVQVTTTCVLCVCARGGRAYLTWLPLACVWQQSSKFHAQMAQLEQERNVYQQRLMEATGSDTTEVAQRMVAKQESSPGTWTGCIRAVRPCWCLLAC